LQISPLSGGKQTFQDGQFFENFEAKPRMSAFPKSGRSDHWKMGKMKVRFRPEAAIFDVVLAARHYVQI